MALYLDHTILQAVIRGIGELSAKHLPQAREQVRALVREIWLKRTPEGHLEATLTVLCEGLVKRLYRGKLELNLGDCGERIGTSDLWVMRP